MFEVRFRHPAGGTYGRGFDYAHEHLGSFCSFGDFSDALTDALLFRNERRESGYIPPVFDIIQL